MLALLQSPQPVLPQKSNLFSKITRVRGKSKSPRSPQISLPLPNEDASTNKPTTTATFKTSYEEFCASVEKHLPDLKRKIDFIVPPTLTFLHKIAKDAPIP